MFKNKLISESAKLNLYETIIRPIVIYASETSVLKEADMSRLLVFERKILRRIKGPIKERNGTWRLRWNNELYSPNNNVNIINFIKYKKLRWLGYLQRMQKGRLPKETFNWKPEGIRPKGRPKHRWEDDVRNDLRRMGINNWRSLTLNRKEWQKAVEKAKTFNWKL